MKYPNSLRFGTLRVLACFLIIGGGLCSCDSPAENVEKAKENLKEAQVEMADAKGDSLQKVQWQEFKATSVQKIAENKEEILLLRVAKTGLGTKKDAAYADQIASLETRNDILQSRINDYEKYYSGWEVFKREFNHDMEDLSKSFRDISKDNLK